MEDALMLLPDANHKAINNVHLYLRVTYLSEITDSSGLFILPEYRTEMTPATGSTIRWPSQVAPLPENWKIWVQTIQTLYTQPNSPLLRNKLAAWDSQFALAHWNWEWHIDPETMALYQHT